MISGRTFTLPPPGGGRGIGRRTTTGVLRRAATGVVGGVGVVGGTAAGAVADGVGDFRYGDLLAQDGPQPVASTHLLRAARQK
jgi:hypothetical protein